jgi:hypothetical protein
VPHYDYGLIAGFEALIAESETGWRQLYDELGITPYQVVYQELSSPDGYQQRSGACWLIWDLMTTTARSQSPGRAANERPQRGMGDRLPHGPDVPQVILINPDGGTAGSAVTSDPSLCRMVVTFSLPAQNPVGREPRLRPRGRIDGRTIKISGQPPGCAGIVGRIDTRSGDDLQEA